MQRLSQPAVSVIIPVYNAGKYLLPALESTQRQGPLPGGLEVIVADDGSTDGSSEVADRFAREHRGICVLHLRNTGGPGAPRNAALDVARGRYVFFLDADDLLADNAMTDLVATADECHSDVVIGQVRGIDGRTASGATFAQSRAHVDLQKDRVFRTLGPWKLFRRSLLEEHGMRFRSDVKIAEDQLLVAHAYLAASNISICADRPYYLLREKDEGAHLSKTRRGPVELADAFARLTEVIVLNTSPGPLRDAVLWRAVTWSLAKSLDRRYLRGTSSEQEQVVERIRTVLGPVYTPAVADHQGALLRTKTALALEGRVSALRRVIEWEVAHLRPRRLVRPDEDGLHFAMPQELKDEVGAKNLRRPVPTAIVELARCRVSGQTVEISGAATIRSSDAPAPAIELRLRERESGETVERVATRVARLETEAGVGSAFEVTISSDRLHEGIWDAWVVQRMGETKTETRFGARRVPGILEQPAVFGNAVDGARGVVYFTKKAGNLSLDVGFRVHPREECCAGCELPSEASSHAVEPRTSARVQSGRLRRGNRLPGGRYLRAAVKRLLASR